MTNFTKIRNYHKSSQIFLLDFIVATVLIVVSVGTFFVYYSFTDPQEDLFDTAYRLSNVMSSTKINDLNNDFVRDLFINRKITNIDNTLYQQISDFHQSGDTNLAINLTEQVVDTYLIDRIGYNITLDNGTSIIELDSSGVFLSQDESKTVASVQRQVFGFEDSDPFLHVYTIEVWRN